MQEMVFENLEPVEVPVTLGSKRYILRQPSSAAATKYRDALFASATMIGGTIRPNGVGASAEPTLVADCLFELYDDKGTEKRRKVLLSFVNELPDTVVTAMFAKLKEISPSIVSKAEEAKKPQGEPQENGMDTSDSPTN